VPPQYVFVGGHEVPAGDTHFAHLVWTKQGTGGHRMLSVYQAPDPGGDPPEGWPSIERAGMTYWTAPVEDEEAIFCRARSKIYVVAGQLPRDELLDMAATVCMP
ncbi:MAG TPA: hypothetical protein VM536_05910, partial [Chloroflexia bacterium]|nr:hypothetical protein [Chloroflexia bacterium]